MRRFSYLFAASLSDIEEQKKIWARNRKRGVSSPWRQQRSIRFAKFISSISCCSRSALPSGGGFIRSDSSIADLHHVLQIIMGWDDTHLHRVESQLLWPIPRISEPACCEQTESSDRMSSIDCSQEDCIDGTTRDEPALLLITPACWRRDRIQLIPALPSLLFEWHVAIQVWSARNATNPPFVSTGAINGPSLISRAQAAMSSSLSPSGNLCAAPRPAHRRFLRNACRGWSPLMACQCFSDGKVLCTI